LKKKAYQAPKLTVQGDIARITMGDDLGEDLDAMFRTHSLSASKGKSKKDDRFS